MKRYLVLSLLFLFTASLGMYAIPARNIPVTVRQPDGTELRIIVSGDEFYHTVTTEDGCAVTEGEDGYWYYAAYDFNGAQRSSGVRVDPRNGATAAAAASRIVPHGTLLAEAGRRREAANRLRAAHRLRVSPDTKAGAPTRKAIIILAQFTDLTFKFERSAFVNMLTQIPDRFPLLRTEIRLALRCEDFRNASSFFCFDILVQIDQPAAQPGRQRAPAARLSRPHETD